MKSPGHQLLVRMLCAVGLLALSACGQDTRTVLLGGQTMGSNWTVKLVLPAGVDRSFVQAGIQSQFDRVDEALSTYRVDSALSQFNASAGGQWQTLDAELLAVLEPALLFSALSGGAYDVTVGPLVDLWGFGPQPARVVAPNAVEIESARSRVGWQKVELDTTGRRARKPAGVRVDLSSLGKGRGVDRVAQWLDAAGVENYLIDLSGKLRARGLNPNREPWRVGVELPGADHPSGDLLVLGEPVRLRNQSIATAGDYRRFFRDDGKHYSHLIDPHSGRPVDHATASATVQASDCLSADAWATLLVVMPSDRALRIAESHGVAALLVLRDGRGFRTVRTSTWGARPPESDASRHALLQAGNWRPPNAF